MLDEGDDFAKLRPVTVICFLDATLFADIESFHTRFELLEHTTHKSFSSHCSIHVIELPKFKRTALELITDLDRWTYFLRHGQELDPATLPETLNTPAIRSALGRLEAMSLNTAERLQYEARLNYQRDQSCYLETAREEGLELGREEGLELGREEGLERGRKESILRIGRKRFGEPPAELKDKILEIRQLNHLDGLLDRILDCPSWAELFDPGIN